VPQVSTVQVNVNDMLPSAASIDRQEATESQESSMVSNDALIKELRRKIGLEKGFTESSTVVFDLTLR
jgi:hypothetical protein